MSPTRARLRDRLPPHFRIADRSPTFTTLAEHVLEPTLNDLLSAPDLTGAKARVIAGTNTMTISGLTGVSALHVGQLLFLSGTAEPTRSGVFRIGSVPVAETAVVSNPGVVAGTDAAGGQIAWRVYLGGDRAALDCAIVSNGLDTILEAAEPGEEGVSIRVSGSLGTETTCATSANPPQVRLSWVDGVTTVAEMEAAILAEELPDGVQRLVRVRRPGTAARVLTNLDVFNPAALRGSSPTGHVLGPISVDGMGSWRDPTTCEPRLLPWLADGVGWPLDTSLPIPRQRALVQNAVALHRLRGTAQGLQAALRAALGVEVAIQELWPDAWRLGRSRLGLDTLLAPNPIGPGWATALLKAAPPASFEDGDHFAPDGYGPKIIIQKTPQAGGEHPFGFLTAQVRDRLANNLWFALPAGAGYQRYEFRVDSTYQAATPAAAGVELTAIRGVPSTVLGVTTIDVSDAAFNDPVGGPPQVAGAIHVAIAADHGVAAVVVSSALRSVETPVDSPTLRLEHDSAGTGGNAPIYGSAVDVLEIVGLVGGAPGPVGWAIPFVVPGGYVPVSLMGAATAEDVAARMAGVMRHFHISPTKLAEVRRRGQYLALRWGTKGAGDTAFRGRAAGVLQASASLLPPAWAEIDQPFGAGTTTYTYLIVARDAVGHASAPLTITTRTGPVARAVGATNRVRWAPVRGAVSYDVLDTLSVSAAVGLREPIYEDDGSGRDSYPHIGLIGAQGPSRALRTFTVVPERRLTDAEMRIASALVEQMKPAETHGVIANPPIPVRRLILGPGRLGDAISSLPPLPPRPIYTRAPWFRQAVDTIRVQLDETASHRTHRLQVGACYEVVAEDAVRIAQGGARVTAAAPASGAGAAIAQVHDYGLGLWVQVTGLAGIKAWHVDHYMRVSGAATTENNGEFLIVAVDEGVGSAWIANAAGSVDLNAVTWAVDGDQPLAAGERVSRLFVDDPARAYIAVLRQQAGGAAYAYISRVDADEGDL